MAVRVCHLSSVRENHDLCMFRRSCVSLAEAGYEVYLVARGDSREDMGVYVTGVGEPPRSRLRRMLFFTRRIFREALEVDAAVYQIHDPELLPFALTLKRRGKRVIFDSHEFYTELLKTKHYLPFARQTARVYGTFERYVLRRIDAVIFPATRDGKEVFSGIAQRTVTIGNYALKEELYSWYVPAEKPEFRLCFVGDMTPDRGIDNLIRAANRSGARLSLVGEFHPPSYGEAVRQMPESRCVEFLGRLDRERVREVLARSSVGMCTMPDGGQYNICDTFNMKVYLILKRLLPVLYIVPIQPCGRAGVRPVLRGIKIAIKETGALPRGPEPCRPVLQEAVALVKQAVPPKELPGEKYAGSGDLVVDAEPPPHLPGRPARKRAGKAVPKGSRR